MKRTCFAPPGASRIFAFFLAVGFALIWATTAHAQIQDDQYGAPTPPSGPAAGAQCTVPNDTNGVVDPGDTIICEGNFSVSQGASVILEDVDGTQGTHVDGQNSQITEGSLIISVTGEPANVNGGNDVLNTEGLFVVATTGVSADGGPSGVVDAAVGVLPDTGGPLLLLAALGALAISGGGLGLLRLRAGRR